MNKQATIIFEALIKSINEQWDIANTRIISLSVEIEGETHALKDCTAMVEENERQIIDTDQCINDLNCQLTTTNSEISDLNCLISSYNKEIEECNEKIKQQQSHNVVLDVLNHIFNPIGAAINDIVFACTNTIRELNDKINRDRDEISTKTNLKQSLETRVAQYQNSLLVCKYQSDMYAQRRLSIEDQIKMLGIQKTQNGTLQVSLEKLRTRLRISLDNAKQDIELLDFSVNMVDEAIKEVKDIYNSNCISFDFHFIDEASVPETTHYQPITQTFHNSGFYMTAL